MSIDLVIHEANCSHRQCVFCSLVSPNTLTIYSLHVNSLFLMMHIHSHLKRPVDEVGLTNVIS